MIKKIVVLRRVRRRLTRIFLACVIALLVIAAVAPQGAPSLTADDVVVATNE